MGSVYIVDTIMINIYETQAQNAVTQIHAPEKLDELTEGPTLPCKTKTAPKQNKKGEISR